MRKSIFLLIAIMFLTVKNQSQTVTDYDGNVYDTIVIGDQVWLKENLKVTHYNNGDPIPNVVTNTAWAALATGARCYYNNDSLTFDSVYGSLYNWYAVSNTNKLCPVGWHVSTNAEWISAENYLQGSAVAGGKMKETGTSHWASPNAGATNSSGFTGLPGGMRDPVNNDFRTAGENGLWWTTTVTGSYVWSTYMWYLFGGIDHNPAPKKYGFSVRCVKDITTGTEYFESPGEIKLYPNPSTDRVIIECTEWQNVNLQIYNLLGELLLQQGLTDRSSEIDIRSLPKGVFWLKSSGPLGNWQMKLVKK